nr:unnamed protein product [Spirometra erinaceieuropaei]
MNLRRTPTYLDKHFLLPPVAREGHLDASSVASVAPAGSCPRPEATPAGRASDKGDLRWRRMDRPSPRHLEVANSPTASQETSNNELALRIDNFPVLDAATSDENASVEN